MGQHGQRDVPVQCVLEKVGEPASSYRTAFRLLQFLPRAFKPSRDACDGSGYHRSRVGIERVAGLR